MRGLGALFTNQIQNGLSGMFDVGSVKKAFEDHVSIPFQDGFQSQVLIQTLIKLKMLQVDLIDFPEKKLISKLKSIACWGYLGSGLCCEASQVSDLTDSNPIKKTRKNG